MNDTLENELRRMLDTAHQKKCMVTQTATTPEGAVAFLIAGPPHWPLLGHAFSIHWDSIAPDADAAEKIADKLSEKAENPPQNATKIWLNLINFFKDFSREV
jgi:hypothetical protein